jgi:hypothetical protein
MRRYVKAPMGVVLGFSLLILNAHRAAAQVNLTAPTGGQTLSGSAAISVSAAPNVSWVNFYVDGFALASSPPYSTNWDTRLDLNGTHFVQVKAYDSGGAMIGHDEVTVRIANATPTPTPVPPGYFATLRPNAALPSASKCSSLVLSKSSTEAVPANTPYNQNTPSAVQLSDFHAQPLWNAEAPAADFARVDGNFAATTDQVIAWASCKWGLDENAMRGESWDETNWIQSTYADRRTDYAVCHTPKWDGWDGSQCWQSYGIFQAKMLDYNIWSEGRDSTAFNSDFRGAYLRACMNGDVSYLSGRTPAPGYPTYTGADPEYMFWGCMGQWASGGWFDVGAIEYITAVRRTTHAAPWPHSKDSQTVSISQPLTGATVSGVVTIKTWLSPTVVWENVYIDGEYFASSPPANFSWNSRGSAVGTHTISARAFDAKGKQIGSVSIIVNVK